MGHRAARNVLLHVTYFEWRVRKTFLITNVLRVWVPLHRRPWVQLEAARLAHQPPVQAGNHQGDIGFTDCLSRGEEQLLIASTLHIDSGDGGINIFQDTESGLKYLATLRPPSSPRLFCLASGGPPGSLSVIAEVWKVQWSSGVKLSVERWRPRC